ncbi:MAG: hypothetical protein WAM91_13245 [Candidatus Acidiferrales bacterium]
MTTTNPQTAKIGEIVQFAGIGAFLAGAVLSIHHYAIAAFVVGGAAAFFIGKKLRGQ